MIPSSTRPYKGKSLSSFPHDYTVIDIETTGLGHSLEIIELSAVRFRSCEITDSFRTLVRPEHRVPPFITALTGITDEMARGGADPAHSLDAFLRFVGGDILLGYNVNFDVNAIYDNSLRYLGRPLTNDFVDVLLFARRALPQLVDRKQTTVARHFGISVEGAHRAYADCIICNECYKRLAQMLKG